jgi:membrane protease YdiL (CAAX protease family)
MNFCTRCGTKVSGKFCTVCGQRTAPPDGSPAAPGGDGTLASPRPTPASEVGQIAPRRADEEPNEPEHSEATASTSSTAASASTTPPTTRRFRWKAPAPAGVVLPEGHARRQLVLETRFVMIAFLVPVVINAALVLAQQQSGVGETTRFATIVHHNPLENMFLGMLAYLPVAAVVPLALFLLARTGQDRHVLGLELPRFDRDVFPAIGLGLAAFGVELVMLIPFLGFLNTHKGFINTVTVGNEPKYYLIEGIFISAVTAVTEEVLVNGYIITRLGQLGWTNQGSLVLSLALRTSYHIYYGWGFLLTVPLGYFVTRSFQKHHKLTRPIVTHFLYDAILITISILK